MNIKSALDEVFHNREVKYKTTVSLILGLLGFVLNFFPVNFATEKHQASFLLGAVFPMIVAIAWGWKYGLLSATLGLGCQSMWFLWMPKSGWAPFVSVPPFTAWVVWHGWCNEKYKKTGERKWQPYIAEIPFRIVNSVLIYTAFRWLFNFNPPPWAPNASTHMALSFAHFIVVKEVINGYFVLLVVDVLLVIAAVRGFFRLPQHPKQENVTYVMSAMFLLAFAFWLIDSFITMYMFNPERLSMLDLLGFDVPTQSLYIRSAFLVACLTGGVVASEYMKKQSKSEKELHRSREKTERILASSPISIIVTDLQGRILECNQAALDIFGYKKRKQMIGTFAEDLVGQEHKQRAGEDILETQTTGLLKNQEYSFQTKTGATFCGEISMSVTRDTSGSPVSIVMQTQDISDRKTAELQRQEQSTFLEQLVEERTAELHKAQGQLIRKEKLAALGKLAGTVAHELRNPLGAMKNSAYLLNVIMKDFIQENQDKDKVALDFKESLQILNDEVAKSERIITTLLDFARPRRPLFVKLEIDKFIRQLISNTKLPSTVQLHEKLEDGLPPSEADTDMLQDAFANIILNAVQAMPHGGELTILSAWDKKTDKFCISISDTGVGISEEDQKVIFEPLFTTKAKGVGLGLAIAQEAIEAHNGTITVNSYLGKGTTFTICLPVVISNQSEEK